MRIPPTNCSKTELVKANEDLKGFTAKARATAPVVETYRQQALLMDQKGIQRQDLIRNVKAAEDKLHALRSEAGTSPHFR